MSLTNTLLQQIDGLYDKIKEERDKWLYLHHKGPQLLTAKQLAFIVEVSSVVLNLKEFIENKVCVMVSCEKIAHKLQEAVIYHVIDYQFDNDESLELELQLKLVTIKHQLIDMPVNMKM
jgi:hypothetical protein